MVTLIKHTRWTASVLAAVLAALLLWVGQRLQRTRVPMRSNNNPSDLPTQGLPYKEVTALFSTSQFSKLVPAARLLNPFYSRYFQPPPAPKAPSTRKVALIYQGFYETANGRRQAYVKVGDNLVVSAPGEKIVADLAVAEVTLRTLALTNMAGQTNLFMFKAPQEVEIPVQ